MWTPASASLPSKVPLEQMVLGVVGSEGQICPIVFIGVGERVDADISQDLLGQSVVPWVQRTYPIGIRGESLYSTLKIKTS